MFRSLFLAGFECTSARLSNGRRLNLTRAVRHDEHLDQDYQRLAEVGIRAVREGLSWPESAATAHYDFDWLRSVLAAVQRHDLTLILDLCHFGYPDWLNPFEGSFRDAFCEYAGAVATVVATETSAPVAFVPINEPSYFAWAGGEVGMFAPFSVSRGGELKRALIGAAIAAIDVIQTTCPAAKIINTDPLCFVVPGQPGDEEIAARFNTHDLYEAWDMLAGRLAPELGGSPDHLGIVGVNYYPWNQWEFGAPFVDALHHVRQPLADDDPRRRPPQDLLLEVFERYGAPVMISETSCAEPYRAEWIKNVTSTARLLVESGKPLTGVCIYPVLSMPLWLDAERWLHMGLWDIGPPKFERQPAPHAIAALRSAQRDLRLK